MKIVERHNIFIFASFYCVNMIVYCLGWTEHNFELYFMIFNCAMYLSKCICQEFYDILNFECLKILYEFFFRSSWTFQGFHESIYSTLNSTVKINYPKLKDKVKCVTNLRSFLRCYNNQHLLNIQDNDRNIPKHVKYNVSFYNYR